MYSHFLRGLSWSLPHTKGLQCSMSPFRKCIFLSGFLPNTPWVPLVTTELDTGCALNCSTATTFTHTESAKSAFAPSLWKGEEVLEAPGVSGINPAPLTMRKKQEKSIANFPTCMPGIAERCLFCGLIWSLHLMWFQTDPGI